jgi:hypothetical protein
MTLNSTLKSRGPPGVSIKSDPCSVYAVWETPKELICKDAEIAIDDGMLNLLAKAQRLNGVTSPHAVNGCGLIKRNQAKLKRRLEDEPKQ